ncbi:MAG: hypothetical protein WCO63_07500 [Bacteroidota bacterium]
MKQFKQHIQSTAIIFATIIMLFPHSRVLAQGKIKIGTYDSRVVVFAFSRSQYFPSHIKDKQKAYNDAQEAHDTVKMDEALYSLMSFQHLLHQMVFCTGSAIPVLDSIKSKIPELAKKNGLVAIVSKFELNYSDPDITLIDITNEMAALFNPKEDISKMAKDIRNAEPVPLEEFTFQEEIESYVKQYPKRYNLPKR